MALRRFIFKDKHFRHGNNVTVKYFCFIVLFSFLLWITRTSNLEEEHILVIRRNTDEKYYTSSYSYVASVNLSGPSNTKNRRKSICHSRRFQGLKVPNGTIIGSKDFHLQQRCYKTPMQKIFESFGQHFGGQIDNPDFKKLHDFQLYSTPQYLTSFKNPCFYKNVTLGQYTRSRDVVSLRCVPYFMIAGFPKCGTTDLWHKLKQQPEVAWLHAKEINFFNKKQYDILKIENAVDFYQRTLAASTDRIKKCVPKKITDVNPCITGEASVDTVFDNKFWRQLPGNEIAKEPKLTNANYVHKINSNMKVIVLLREPIERLYSDYIYMSSSIGYVPSPEDFHVIAADRISNFTSCLRHRNLRACAYDVYDDWNIQTYKVRLNVGIYHVFLQDWLQVFPRQNVFIVKSEDTRGPSGPWMFTKILKFLGLTVPTRQVIEEMYNDFYANQRHKDNKQMLKETKLMLQDFYRAYNTELNNLVPYIRY